MVRLDWGAVGGVEVARYAAESGAAVCAVVVDVLSFTTTVSVAMDRGMIVHPYRWRGDGAEQFAREVGAVLAVSRREAHAEGGVSLPRVDPALSRPADRAAVAQRLHHHRAARRDRGHRGGGCAAQPACRRGLAGGMAAGGRTG